MAEPRVALVHDWMTSQGGGERVLWALHLAYPEAPIYTSVLVPEALPQFADLDVRTSFLQKWPLAKRRHQLYPTLRTIAFESFDFSDFDVVISSSSAEAKGIITKPETLHVCYCHTPMRYYWSDYAKYRANPGFGLMDPLVRMVMPSVIEKMRQWDFAAAQRVDAFIANSEYVQRRIEKYYRRESTVINPPIDADRFAAGKWERKGFIAVSRLIPYKRVDLAVRACSELGVPLTVIGDGSEMSKLQRIAGSSVTFKGRLSDAETARAYAHAEALLFTAEEDFGLVPLEAMAAGTPVIAYGKGGATETVIPGKTGTHFEDQTVESLKTAIESFDAKAFDRAAIQEFARGYDQEVFIEKIKKFVADHLEKRQISKKN